MAFLSSAPSTLAAGDNLQSYQCYAVSKTNNYTPQREQFDLSDELFDYDMNPSSVVDENEAVETHLTNMLTESLKTDNVVQALIKNSDYINNDQQFMDLLKFNPVRGRGVNNKQIKMIEENSSSSSPATPVPAAADYDDDDDDDNNDNDGNVNNSDAEQENQQQHVVMKKNTDTAAAAVAEFNFSRVSTRKRRATVDSNKVVAERVKKVRGRYHRKKLPDSEDITATSLVPSEIVTSSAMLSYTVNCSEMVAMPQNVTNCNDSQFIDHVTNVGYYMFVVCQSQAPDEMYKIFYSSCVSSVTQEYATRYNNIDRMVLVVSFDKFRFMISHRLLQVLNIKIPRSEDFNEKLINSRTQKCHFSEIKDFAFLSLLTNFFQLDMIYAKAKMILLLASVGEEKARVLLNEMTMLLHSKDLFRTPLFLHKKDNVTAEVNYDVVPYVENIVKMSSGMRFRKMPVETGVRPYDNALHKLQFWLKAKTNRNTKDEEAFFTYKYGSVVRLLYSERENNLNELVKIKNNKNGGAHFIESYLDACANRVKDHNFLLISIRSDERVTIIHMGNVFIWITSVIKDILPNDIIGKFKRHHHHVFNLNRINRKEINNRHNGMIRLMSFYTGSYLTLDQCIKLAEEKFGCNYECKMFN